MCAEVYEERRRGKRYSTEQHGCRCAFGGAGDGPRKLGLSPMRGPPARSPRQLSECHRRKDTADCGEKGGLRQERFRTWVWDCPCQSLLERIRYLMSTAGSGPPSRLAAAPPASET